MSARPAMWPITTSPDEMFACSRVDAVQPDPARCHVQLAPTEAGRQRGRLECARYAARLEPVGRSIVMATEPFLSPGTVVLTDS